MSDQCGESFPHDAKYGTIIPMLYHRNLDASQPSGSRDLTPPLVSSAHARVRFGSGSAQVRLRSRFRSAHLVYAPRRSQDLSHQKSLNFLRGARKVSPQSRGPESVTTVHSQPHRQMRRFEPSLSRLHIFPLPSPFPSSHPSYLLSLRSLSHLSSKTSLSRSYSRYLHPRIQNPAYHEHRAGKRMLERTEYGRADRGSLRGWALRAA